MTNQEQTRQDKSSPKYSSKDNLYISNKVNQEAGYFVAGPNAETDRTTNSKTIIKIQSEFSNVLQVLDLSRAPFHLKVKEDTKLYQIPPKHVAYSLKKHFKRVRKNRRYWYHWGLMKQLNSATPSS